MVSVPIEHTENEGGTVSDQAILDVITELTDESGKRPGRDRVKSAVPGIGSPRVARLLKEHARSAGEELVTTSPALRVIPAQSPARSPETLGEAGEQAGEAPGERSDQAETCPPDQAGERADAAESARADEGFARSQEPGEFARWSAFAREIAGRKLAARLSTDQPDRASPARGMTAFLWVTMALVSVPALLTIWSGWVSLGLATGWRSVQLFPSVPGLSGIHLNTVVFLPFSVEILTVVSMGFFLHYRGKAIRRTAGLTAVATVGLGLFGQAWSHHLQATGEAAPSWLVVFTASLPVLALAAVSLLVHLAANEHARAQEVGT